MLEYIIIAVLVIVLISYVYGYEMQVTQKTMFLVERNEYRDELFALKKMTRALLWEMCNQREKVSDTLKQLLPELYVGKPDDQAAIIKVILRRIDYK